MEIPPPPEPHKPPNPSTDKSFCIELCLFLPPAKSIPPTKKAWY